MHDLLGQLRIIFWMVLHYRWIALGTASLAAVGGWVAVEFVPDTYEVSAKVYLDTGSVLKPLLKGLAVENTLREDSAAMVHRTLVTRPNLLALVQAIDLDLTVETDLEMERLIQSITKRIEVSGGGARKNQANLYSVSFYDSSPQVARDVVAELLNVFLEKTLGITRQDSSGAALFLDKQIKVYKERLEAAEETLKKFKMENSGVMPGEANSFYQKLERANNDLSSAQLMLVEATRKLAGIQQELTTVSRTAEDSQRAGTSIAPRSPLQERINALQEQLDELQLRYTDQHPDVIATARMLDQLLERRSPTDAGGRQAVLDAGQMAVNPAYQQLAVLRGGVKAEVDALEARVAEFKRRRDVLQSNVDIIPELETAYLKLTRDYSITLQTYEELVKRRESARIAQRADESSDKVQFRIIEPPVLPLFPTGPNRLLLAVGVFFAALGVGGGLAWLLAQLKPSFYTREQIVESHDWPVLGMVSMVWSSEQIASRRKELVMFLGAVGLLFLLFFANMARIFLALV